MSLTPPAKPPYVTKIPAGVHMATCYLIADIGRQRTTYQGREQIKRQVILAWELHEERMEDGRPLVVSHTYTNTLGERATLRKHLDSWRGRAFTKEEIGKWSLTSVLGVPCQISIVHEAKGDNLYHRIASIVGLPKGIKAPKLVNPAVAYDHDEADAAALGLLPEWIREKVMAALPEPVETTADSESAPVDEDSLPF